MATPGRSAADYKAELAMKIQGSLTKEQFDAYGNALGRVITGQYDIAKKRADRATQVTKVAGDYARALDSGVKGKIIDAAVNLYKIDKMLPIEFAKAAYAPNWTTLGTVEAAIPVSLRDDAQRRTAAWKAFFRSARPDDGNIIGTWNKMTERYGKFDPSYLDDEASQTAYRAFSNVQKIAEQNAAQFEEQMNTTNRIGQSWDAWLEQNPNLDPTSPDTYALFAQQHQSLLNSLPKPGSTFINQLQKVAANPEQSKEFFSDLDAMEAEAVKQEEKYLGLLGAGKEAAGAERERTDLEKKVAWLQRSDVQAWGKKWGYNLGTVQPVTPEIQKLIDAGQISKDSLVNGMLYTPSPDDERAARFALRQLGRNPQKNIFYQAGLTKQAGPRTVMEIEEIVRPEGLKAVRGGLIVTPDGKTARIVQLEDNSYAVGDPEGKKFTRISVESGDQMVKDVQMVDFPEGGASVPGLPPHMRTRRIQSLGPELYRDASGAERGIDLDTGEMVVIPPEKIASKEVTHGGAPRKTLGEALLERRAARTVKKEGIDISTEAQNAMDIGPEATKKQIRESAQTTAEIAKGLPAVPASYVGEGLAGRVRGPLTEAEIARQDVRTATGAAGVSPFEQVKPGDYKERKISSSPQEQATQKAAESAMFDKALSEAAASKPRLPVVSPAPGVVTSGLPGAASKQGPKGDVLGANVRDTELNRAVRSELAKRPGGNVAPASEKQYEAARAAALKKGATTEPIAEPEEAPKPPSLGEEITAAMREEREVPALPEQQDMKKKYVEATRQAYAAATARARAEQAAQQRPGRPPPVSPPLP